MKILKFGSKGQSVKDLQIFLGLNPDGDFGQKTEIAVSNFQLRHKLVTDGIVGERTYRVLFNLGFKSQDMLELGDFEIKNYFLPESHYFKGPTKKRWIFLHHTHGWHNPFKVIDDWKKRKTKVATHFVIGGIDIHNEDHSFDGQIVQSMPEEAYSWHLGIGNQAMHRESIGIELCSFGYLEKGFYFKKIKGKKTKILKDPEKFYTTSGIEVNPIQVEILDKPFRGKLYFHKYSQKQLKSLKNLLEFLGYEHQIDITKGLPELYKKIGINAFDKIDIKLCRSNPGIWSHSNVAIEKWDVNPSVFNT